MKSLLLSAMMFCSVSAFAQDEATITCGVIKEVIGSTSSVTVVLKKAQTGSKEGLGPVQRRSNHDFQISSANQQEQRKKIDELKALLAYLRVHESVVCLSSQVVAGEVVNTIGTGVNSERAFADLQTQM